MSRTDNVFATYYIESFSDLGHAADALAGEQSSGTFVPVPGETPELVERHGARVVEIERLGDLAEPSLPGASRPLGAFRVHAGRVTIEFPLENFGPSLPNLQATVMGNLYELGELGACRLLDIDLPAAFDERYGGPRFGVAGTRELMDAPQGAMVGAIVKPSVGLGVTEHAAVVQRLAEANADFCKDDELIANPPYSPLRERVKAVMAAIERAADRTGRKLMYAFNITDDIDRLRANHDLVVEAGGTCVMVCINAISLAGVAHLRSFCELPIHGHRTMLGALMRHPALGIEFRAFQKLARLAGVDHLHAGGMNSKFYETNEQVARSIRAVREPLFGGYSCLPVLSSAQWAGTCEVTYRMVATDDVLTVAGGGIFAHPGGIRAGVDSIRMGWQAAVAEIPVGEHAHGREALAQAIAAFGARS